MQEILRQTVSACNELLRHFWAQFPLTNAKRVGGSAIMTKAYTGECDAALIASGIRHC